MKIKFEKMWIRNRERDVVMKRIFVIGSILLLVLFTLVEFTLPRTSGLNVKSDMPEKRVSAEELRRKLDRIQKDYQADCERLLADFNRRLEKEVSGEFISAENAVPSVVDELSGIGAGVKLCYKLAKDKLSGSQDFEEAYLAVMDEPVIQPCLRGRRIACGLLEELQQHLRERYAQYSMEVAQLGVSDEAGLQLSETDLAQLEASLSAFVVQGKKLQMTQGAAALGVALELAFFRKSCKMLFKLFAKPAEKVASSLGIGAICAVADGPIPVGDLIGGVITAGGLAWTVYDVYQVTCVLPEEMEEELRNGIRQTQDTLLEESRTLARNLANGYCRSGSAVYEQLSAQLK